MARRFCNMTPHTVHIFPATGEPVIIPPCGLVPRLISEPQQYIGEIEGVPIFSPARFTGIEPDIGHFESYIRDARQGLIFSRLVAEWLVMKEGFTWPGGIYNPAVAQILQYVTKVEK